MSGGARGCKDFFWRGGSNHGVPAREVQGPGEKALQFQELVCIGCSVKARVCWLSSPLAALV